MLMKLTTDCLKDGSDCKVKWLFFLQCSDANRRISQLSLITMMEFAKGSSGELRLGKENSSNLDGIDFVLQVKLISVTS